MTYRTVAHPSGIGIRCFYPDVDHVEVARYLREQAASGFLRGIDQSSLLYRMRCTCGVNLSERNNSVSLIFTRDAIPTEPSGWHLSVCCVTPTGFRAYEAVEGEHWADLVFGKYRAHRVTVFAPSNVGEAKGVHHFRLDCDWGNESDPAVRLEGIV
jgi:hypothetical protein